jgi:hypothetical protein
MHYNAQKKERKEGKMCSYMGSFWFRKKIRQEETRNKRKKENIKEDSCGDDNIGGLFLFFSVVTNCHRQYYK